MTDPYHAIPEPNYICNGSAASRLDGIEVMKLYCSGSSVLDLGCAESLCPANSSGTAYALCTAMGKELLVGYDGVKAL